MRSTLPTDCRGRFVTLEGIEGAGKSTQLANLAEILRELQVPFVQTREPGGTPIAERMRALLIDPDSRGLCPAAELLLVFAARAEHLTKTVLPALDRGDWVLCDRFTDASFAYQGGGRGIPVQVIEQLEHFVQQRLRPDLTFLFDLSAEVGLARARARARPDRFESETLAFFQRARAEYRRRAEMEPARFRVIDAERPLVQVTQQVRADFTAFVEHARQSDA